MSDKIVVKFEPEYTGSGSTSYVSWNNESVKQALDLFFKVRKNEKITGIEIDNNGITARFAFIKEER